MIVRTIAVATLAISALATSAPTSAQDRSGVLSLALVIPITAPPLYTAGAERAPDAVQRVRELADALDRLNVPDVADLPFALAPSSVLCDELHLLRFSAGDRPATRRVFQTIYALSSATRLVRGPYADVRLTDLGSSRAVTREIQRGPLTGTCLNRNRNVVLAPGLAVDDDVVEGAERAGATVLLASANDVTRGPILDGGVTLVPTVSVGHSDTPNDAYARLQGLGRAAALVPLDRPDIATFIRALANDPRIKLVTIRDVAAEPVERPSRSVSNEDPPVSYERSLAAATAAWQRLRAFTRPTDRFTTLVRTMLARAGSSAEWNGDWSVGRSRARSLVRLVDDKQRRVSSAQGSVTFTSRRGSVPVTVTNGTTFPVRVRVELSSSKLEFPAGSSRVVTVDPPGDTVVFSALARSTGTFPVDVRLTSPDGRVRFSAAELTVRSTAANIAAIALTAGAAVFFAVWLIRSIRRRHRGGTTGG